MYSVDRKEALDATISCLEDMDMYDKCQKTIIVDGRIDAVRKGWDVVQVPRVGDKFCWGRMWDAGVFTSKNEKIVYLDSDRLLPFDYLSEVFQKLKDDVFLFTSLHFQMLKVFPINECKDFLKIVRETGFTGSEMMGSLRYEARYENPIHRPGKNVMSGSTAFTKKTYQRLKGVDHWYCGHGAYADTDFHCSASVGGCQFIDLQLPELHWPHDKKIGEKSLTDKELWKMSTDNFIYYCVKWKIPLNLAEDLAHQSGIKKARSYVKERVANLQQSPTDAG